MALTKPFLTNVRKGMLYLSLIYILSSCAFHEGMISGSASINDGNFTVVEPAYGYSKTTQVFGFGGLAMPAMVHEARKNMYRNFPLGPDEAYANMAVDFKRSFFPIVNSTLCFVTADKIRFGERTEPIEAPAATVTPRTFFMPGEHILVYNIISQKVNTGVVLDVSNSNELFVLQDDLKFRTVFATLNSNRVAFHYKDLAHISSMVHIGDTLKSKSRSEKVKVVGIAINGYLTQNERGTYKILELGEIEP